MFRDLRSFDEFVVVVELAARAGPLGQFVPLLGRSARDGPLTFRQRLQISRQLFDLINFEIDLAVVRVPGQSPGNFNHSRCPCQLDRLRCFERQIAVLHLQRISNKKRVMPLDAKRRPDKIGPLRLELKEAFQGLRAGGLCHGRNEEHEDDGKEQIANH